MHMITQDCHRVQMDKRLGGRLPQHLDDLFGVHPPHASCPQSGVPRKMGVDAVGFVCHCISADPGAAPRGEWRRMEGIVMTKSPSRLTREAPLGTKSLTLG